MIILLSSALKIHWFYVSKPLSLAFTGFVSQAIVQQLIHVLGVFTRSCVSKPRQLFVARGFILKNEYLYDVPIGH
jgi:hypothetical protein